MNTYNRFMLRFWLILSITCTIWVTVMGFREGFERWYQFYLFALLALLAYFVRRWMMKRMEKHQQWMEEQQNERK